MRVSEVRQEPPVVIVGEPLPNNGMHPARDTHDFMLRGRCGRARDAGPWMALPERKKTL